MAGLKCKNCGKKLSIVIDDKHFANANEEREYKKNISWKKRHLRWARKYTKKYRIYLGEDYYERPEHNVVVALEQICNYLQRDLEEAELKIKKRKDEYKNK